MHVSISQLTDGIKAKASIGIPSEALPFEFRLGSGFVINRITDVNGNPLEFELIGETSAALWYQADASTYRVSDLRGSRQIVIEYSGYSEAQFGANSQSLLSLNPSALWIPFGFGTKEGLDLCVHVLAEDYEVPGFKRTENPLIWRKSFDAPYAFLIIFKSAKVMQNAKAKLYCDPLADPVMAQTAIDCIEDILDRYTKLTGLSNAPSEQIVVTLPIEKNAGAYNDGEKIVLSRFVYDYPELAPEYSRFMPAPLISVFGHELAHFWCTGADANWEDWLNECSAEAFNLWYMRKTGYRDFVENHLEKIRQIVRVDKTPIRTPDGERPQDCHHKGVILFEEVRKRWGEAVLMELLKILVNMPHPDTFAWCQLGEAVSKPAVDFIRKEITLPEFSFPV